MRLAVTTRAETYDRLREILPPHGIDVGFLRATERATVLTETPSHSFDVGLVASSRPMEAGVVDALYGLPWVNDREAILTSRNKAEVLARLSRAGLPVPESVSVSNPVDEDVLVEVFERFDPPVIVKPNSTTRGTGVALAADLDTFLGICDYLSLVHDYRATGDRSFLVQEYVPEATDYRAMVVEGEYVGAVERRLPSRARAHGRWKHNVHRGATAEDVSLPDDLRELAEETARVLDIPYLGVDLLVAGERAVVSETNARPTIDETTKYEPGFEERLAGLIRSRVE
ncbi:ATP-grasp domain-containing protein [Natronorarus salvus]|uniref:ATP-grasp domain-containing protein n=1 Tax=Natronorarus salvus TaxID=3117733 RepID=UPI002F26CD06